MTTSTLLDFENAILDLFEKNRITIQDAKIVLWTLLTAIYEDELIEEPQRRETIIENIERKKEQLLVNIFLSRVKMLMVYYRVASWGSIITSVVFKISVQLSLIYR